MYLFELIVSSIHTYTRRNSKWRSPVTRELRVKACENHQRLYLPGSWRIWMLLMKSLPGHLYPLYHWAMMKNNWENDLLSPPTKLFLIDILSEPLQVFVWTCLCNYMDVTNFGDLHFRNNEWCQRRLYYWRQLCPLVTEIHGWSCEYTSFVEITSFL